MNAAATTNETYTQRIWRHFQADSFACNGLRMVILLFAAAALAPLLANSHALVRVVNGQVSFPVFRSLDPIEWRFLLYVPLAGLVYLGRAWFLRAPRVDFLLFLFLFLVAILLNVVLPGAVLFCFAVQISQGLCLVLCLAIFLLFVLKVRARIFRFSGINFILIPLAVLLVEIFISQSPPINDTSNDRGSDPTITFKIMPPIPYSPIESSTDQFAAPSLKHLCGTDSIGRDIASRMLHATRISLSIGFVSQTIALSIGILLGGVAGYYRSWIDVGVCRVIEIMDCFPPLILILVVMSVVKEQNNIFVIMAVIGLTSWTGVARLVRGEFLRLSALPFSLAARAVGARDGRIILRHLLPNALGPILVVGTFGVASAILLESSLSYLGFGMQAPMPSWGGILSDARRYIDFAWWLAFFPSLAMLITIVSYNFVGEGLRDAVDPRLRVK